MEIHLFKTNSVEDKLKEIKNCLHLLSYSICGLSEVHNIGEGETIALDSLLFRALGHINELTFDRHPLALHYDPDTMYYKTTYLPEEEDWC